MPNREERQIYETVEPPYELWQTVLRENISLRPKLDAELGKSLREDTRQQLFLRARKHTEQLVGLAAALGISIRTPLGADLCWSNSVPLIMAGHQPVLYHSGLLFKAKMHARISEDSRGIGVSVVIDTDVGKGGLLVWPRVIGGSLEIRHASLVTESAESAKVYGAQQIRARADILEVFREVVSDLRQSNLEQAAESAARACAIYAALEGQPITSAHTIARWALSDVVSYEVLLSDLVRETPLQGALEKIANGGRAFAESYNHCLESYRRDHKILNQANPFPNLEISDEETELPLWEIRDGERSPLRTGIRSTGDRKSGGFIAPRGSITTLLLRAYSADLFVHGLGGATYDRFANLFAQSFLGVDLPRFVVASQTRYLFPERVFELSREVELVSQFKEIVSRTEHFLGKDIFTQGEEEALRPLLEERVILRTQINGVLPGEQKRQVALALNDANRKVRELIEGSSLGAMVSRDPSNQAALARWKFREFPYFMLAN